MAATNGIQQGLHNEGFENSKLDDGRLTYPVLLSELDPELVKMQFQMSSMRTIGDPIMYFTNYPGRFIAAPAAIAVSTVMGKAKRDGRWWYYLDDGLYGSYSGQLFDHAKYPVAALRQDGELFESVLAGPTCDSIDVIDDSIQLPELEVGDLVVGRMMGAYTWASATDFNFFKRAKVVVMNEQPVDAKRVVRLQRAKRVAAG